MTEEKSTKSTIPLEVKLYILSLLLIGIPVGFWDVRLGFLVPGALMWLDLFIESSLKTIGAIRVQSAAAKWRKPK